MEAKLPCATRMGGQLRRAGKVEVQREAIRSLSELKFEWQELEHDARTSFFVSWHWIGTLLAVIPEESWPTLVRVHRDKRTVAVALLGQRRERRRGGLVRSRALYLNETRDPTHNLGVEYNDFVAAPDCSELARHALIEWFAMNGAEFDELSINGAGTSISLEVRNHRKLQVRELMYPTYRVELSCLDETGQISSIMSRNGRQQLRRASRYYETFGKLELHRAKTIDEAQNFFGEMKRLHIASWERRGKPHSFSNPFFERFHRLLIERSFNAGAIELIRATAGNQVLGYLYNFRYGTKVYAYQSGFAYPGRGARPGVIAHAMAIQEAHRSGAAVYDFLAGWNRLKQDFATSSQAMFWATVQQPRLGFKLEAFSRQLKMVAGRIKSLNSTKLVAARADLVLLLRTDVPTSLLSATTSG